MSTPYRGPGPNSQEPPQAQPTQPTQPTDANQNPYPAEAPYRPEETLLSGQYGEPAQQGLVAGPAVKERNTIGIIGLVCAVLGLILSCIKGILLLGWILLPIGFVLGLVGLFPKGKEKGTALGAVVTSIIGFIVAAVVFTVVIDDAFNDAFNKETTVTNDEGNKGAVPPGAPTEGQDVTAEGGDGSARENPLPIGATLASDEWEVTVNSVDLDATDAVMAENPYNEEPAPGQTYVMVNVTATYTGDNPQGDMPLILIEYVTPEGNTIDGYEPLVPEPFDMAETLFNGASTTGNVAFLVDEATAAEGVLAVAPDMFSQKRFVAVQAVE